MNSKSGEEQKKVLTSVEVLISTQIRLQSKKSQNDDALILARVLGLDSAHPYLTYSWNKFTNAVVSYSKSKLKRLVAVACSKKSQGNRKLQTRCQGCSVIDILFANARQNFMKCLWFHFHKIGKLCYIFCMKFFHQMFILPMKMPALEPGFYPYTSFPLPNFCKSFFFI